MRARLALAHSLLLCSLVGCADSHGRGDQDASIPRDAAPFSQDAAPADAQRADAGPVPAASCDADDARAAICPIAICDGLPTWHWNGDSCVAIDCGACEGEDCSEGATSREACEAAHAQCEATLCRGSGGEWQWWAQECGHYACGSQPPIDCLIGRPVCRCGDDQIFDPELGCVEADCPAVDPLPRRVMCEGSGGRWDLICCDSVCGELCEADCAAMACDCGVGRIFDALHGCIEAARCFERERGESCAAPGARCAAGTICCDECGGAGCANTPTCVEPVCSGPPGIDTCGNPIGAP